MERQILHVDVNHAFLSWLAVYKLKNGEVFELPVLDDFIDDYDYNVVVIDFVCTRRAAIFGYRDTAETCHLSGLGA